MLIRLPLLRSPCGPSHVVVLAVLALFAFVALPPFVHAVPDADREWQAVQPANDRDPTARHESAAVAVDGKLWLLGGRGNRPVEVFDPETDSWRSAGAAPMELHHFQPAAIGDLIYLVGAFTGGYPNETSVADIHVFDTRTETWSIAGRIPLARVRGSTATAVRDGWIYVVGGNTRGHNAGAVAWLDRWRPADDTWQTLADAPHARDHFSAAFVAERLVATGGRRSAQPDPFIDLVPATDIYDPATQAWSAGKSLTTARAGTVVIDYEGELIVAGGEISASSSALAVVEAYDIEADSWRTLQPMRQGRHSGGGALLDKRFHMVAGSGGRGGGPELDTHETLSLISARDADEDGLSDDAERNIHFTDPSLADTDGDTLEDGDEVMRGTDPLLADTDADGLNDGAELADGTDPLDADSDDDALDDGTERSLGSDPMNPDTDDDTLLDGVEVATHGTDPLKADTDDDTLDDALELDIGTDPLNADTDSDGVGDGVERQRGTDPLVVDSDADGLDDGVEFLLGTDPLDADSDADGLDDGAERALGTDPLDADSDADGLRDGDEIALGSDPLDADSDGDGVSDGEDDAPTAAPRKSGGGGAAGVGSLAGLLAIAIVRRRRFSSAVRTLN